MHFKLKPRKHGRGAYADKPFRFVSIEKAKEAISQFYDQHLKVCEPMSRVRDVTAEAEQKLTCMRVAPCFAGHRGSAEPGYAAVGEEPHASTVVPDGSASGTRAEGAAESGVDACPRAARLGG